MTDRSLEDIIKAASRGNPDAVARLYELYHQGIFRFLYYRTGSIPSAEDLTSEVFLRMVRSVSGFQPGAGSIEAWLYQIARRVLYDWYRNNSLHPEVQLAENHTDPLPLPEDHAERKFDHSMLAQAIRFLSTDQQEVVILRFINGLNLQDTARAIQRSEDAVKGLQRRA
ncbi:MAG: sigma-70 family RNA polymerase sigma factor, partial [Anaerolineaceae bacterium]